jgi:hypothetical protein
MMRLGRRATLLRSKAGVEPRILGCAYVVAFYLLFDCDGHGPGIVIAVSSTTIWSTSRPNRY